MKENLMKQSNIQFLVEETLLEEKISNNLQKNIELTKKLIENIDFTDKSNLIEFRNLRENVKIFKENFLDKINAKIFSLKSGTLSLYEGIDIVNKLNLFSDVEYELSDLFKDVTYSVVNEEININYSEINFEAFSNFNEQVGKSYSLCYDVMYDNIENYDILNTELPKLYSLL